MANMAKIANAPNLNFSSLSVVQASIASTAYTPKATHNRFISTTPSRATAARAGGPGKNLVHRGGFEPP